MTQAPTILTLSLDSIHPYEKNPRDNSDAIASVAESITNFGFLVPIIVDSDDVIVAGHTRYLAAKSLDIEEVPVIRAEHLTERQTQAFRLIDNKTSELARWDFDLLAAEISELAESGLDLVPFGWSEEEVDCLSSLVDADCLAEAADADALAAPAEGGDGVNSAKQTNRGSSVVSKDPKSVRIALGEINFFVDIEQYREWAHEVRKSNGFDMQKVIDDLSGRLGMTARPLRRTVAEQKKDEKDKEAHEAGDEAQPVPSETTEEVTRPVRKRPKKGAESTLRDAVAEAEAT